VCRAGVRVTIRTVTRVLFLDSDSFVPTFKKFVPIRYEADRYGYRESHSDLQTPSLVTISTELINLAGNAADVTTGIVDTSSNASKCTILSFMIQSFA
jgi:hypothetical protein